MSKHVPPPTGEPRESLYLPTDISPEEVFQAIGRLRKEARDEIHRLIRFLDESENHMELEPDDDEPVGDEEPSLGSFDRMADQSKSLLRKLMEFDAGDDAELDTCDDEPALGATNAHFHQGDWAEGNRDDREGDGCADDREGDELEHGGDEHDGREPDEADLEPSLGWTAEGVLGSNLSCEYEIGPGAVAPQNRTRLPPDAKGDGDDLLRGGELRFPGGQKAFDEMMRRIT